MLLEVGEKVYFIDMGTPGVDFLRTRGIAVEDVSAIFITHMHGDHTNGLIPFVDLITWYFKKADPEIFLPVAEAGKAIDGWLKATLNKDEKAVRYRQTEEGVVFDDGVIKVTAYATQHCYRSFGYLVEAEGKRGLFTGDLKNPGVDMPKALFEGKIDLMVCEAAHFPATDYLPVLEKADVERVCITHYSDTFLASVLQAEGELKARGNKALHATDGLCLHV